MFRSIVIYYFALDVCDRVSEERPAMGVGFHGRFIIFINRARQFSEILFLILWLVLIYVRAYGFNFK